MKSKNSSKITGEESTVIYPKVSIIIPVYNGSNYLAQAIDSALNQTYRNIEILVINDGSSDGGCTEKIALSYGNKITYYFKDNGGVASALNFAIEKMTGDFFSWLSHDDLYIENKIEKQISFLSKTNLKKIIIYSNYYVFTTDPLKVIPVELKEIPSSQFCYTLTVGNSLHGCTLLIPKDAFIQVGKFNESLRTTQDYDLWFRMADKFSFVQMPDFLVKSRHHSDQGSYTMVDLARIEINLLHSNFVDKLTKRQLTLGTGKTPAYSYIKIAESFYKRGFVKAGNHAFFLFFKNLQTLKPSEFPLSLINLMNGFLMYFVNSYLRRLIPSFVRLQIRNFLDSKKDSKSSGFIS